MEFLMYPYLRDIKLLFPRFMLMRVRVCVAACL